MDVMEEYEAVIAAATPVLIRHQRLNIEFCACIRSCATEEAGQ